jgi:hypothetical protein
MVPIKNLSKLLFIALFAVILASFTGLHPFAAIVLVLAVGQFPMPKFASFVNSIDAADVVTQFGAHYINEGQNLAKIKNLPYTASKTRGMFRVLPQLGDYFKSTNAQMGSVIQAFQKAFTTKGQIKFKPNAFPLFRLKIDMTIFPDDIMKSYLGFLAGQPDNERANWPIIRYMMEVHLPKAQENDWENKMAFGGEYVTPVDGTAGDAEDSIDGIKAVIKKYNTAGDTNLENGALDFGAIATDPKDFCTQVEEWVESMDPKLRAEIDYIFMSETLATRYKQGKRAKYGRDVAFLTGTGVSNLLTIEDRPSISVMGLLSHEGSDLIWATTPDNRIRPLWRSQLENTFKVESEKRNVHIFTDWYEALEFEVPQLIIHNAADDLA